MIKLVSSKTNNGKEYKVFIAKIIQIKYSDKGVCALRCLTLDEQPVVDHSLNVRVEEPGNVVAHLQVGDVDEGAGRGSQRFLTQDAHDQLPVLHYDLGVPGRDVLVRAAVLLVWMGAVRADHVDVSGND